MYAAEIATLKVGDKVGYARFHNWTMLSGGISSITKINGHGHIRLENGLEFDKRGHQRNEEFGGLTLYNARVIEDDIAAEKDRRATNATYSQLLKMLEDMRPLRIARMSVEKKDAAIALIKRL